MRYREHADRSLRYGHLMNEYDVIATGLQFPEGPVVMPDGSIVLVEVKRGTISRVDPTDGVIDVVARPGGGPNGAAVGPDGALYVLSLIHI